ncbi:MAG: hypothetical protein ACI9S8_001108 [Chlamydiales bacterium]|jgi:hypothetical protein
MSHQQVILASNSLHNSKIPILLHALTARQEEAILEEAEDLISQLSKSKRQRNFDKLSPAHIGVALEYENTNEDAQKWITANVSFFSSNSLHAFLCQASQAQVVSALEDLNGDKYSFAIHHIKDEHLREYVASMAPQRVYRLLDFLEEKQYRVVFRDLSVGSLKNLLPLINSEYVSSAVRTLPKKVRTNLLSPHYASINNYLERTDNFSPYILALAAYSRDEMLWSSLLGRLPTMNFDHIMGMVPALNQAQVEAITPLIQDVIQLESFSKALNLWHIDAAVDAMSEPQREMLAIKFSISDDNLLLFLDEIPPLTIAVGFLFEENKEKLLGLCSLMNSTQLHVIARKMSTR